MTSAQVAAAQPATNLSGLAAISSTASPTDRIPVSPGFARARAILTVMAVVALVWYFVFDQGGSTGFGGLTGASAIDTVRVEYGGCWTGSILQDTSSRSVEGCGSQSFPVHASIVSVLFQKQDASSNNLVVRLLAGSSTVGSQSTSAAYGIATVAH